MEEYILTGKPAQVTGLYIYVDHANPAEEESTCIPNEKAKTGVKLLRGLLAPTLTCCPHVVRWKRLPDIITHIPIKGPEE